MTQWTTLRISSGLTFIIFSLAALAYEVPTAPRNAMTLTATDYVAIQQLVDRYPYVLDHCANGGYDYADLYVENGTFAAASEWGTTSDEQRKFVAHGREKLAIAGGGIGDGSGNCLPPEYNRGYGVTHILANILITPTATGAIGLSRMISVGFCNYPHNMELQAGYEDVYVKTKEGWKFKSRIHVMDFENSLQVMCDSN